MNDDTAPGRFECDWPGQGYGEVDEVSASPHVASGQSSRAGALCDTPRMQNDELLLALLQYLSQRACLQNSSGRTSRRSTFYVRTKATV